MSDTESGSPQVQDPQPQQHPTTGGKSLETIQGQRPRYKSWRKKYRKMKYRFDGVLEENKKLFKDEQKLQGIAKRLREELDGLLDMLLDLNQNPALPTELRFDVNLAKPKTAVAQIPNVVPKNIEPSRADAMLADYTDAVQRGQIPHLDLFVIREQLDKRLAAQGVTTLEDLEAQVPHPTISAEELPEEYRVPHPPGYLTPEEEDAHLLRLDASMGEPIGVTQQARQREKDAAADEKHWADLTPREIERQTELLNPMSQHNWLRANAKDKNPGVEMDDNESLASHDTKPAPARSSKGKRDLAKQVGDRAVGRAREGLSPSAASVGYGDEDEFSFVDEHPSSSGKKRARGDVDGTYRLKGGKSSGSGAKNKRKRSGDDMPSAAAGGKKAKTED